MKTVRLLSILLVLSSAALARDWPQFRGPFFNGTTDEKNLPVSWSTTENIAWSAPLPGPGASTPIVCKDSVFISAADPDADQLKVLCLDRTTGAVKWQYDIAKGIKRTRRSNFASPTAATDGSVVVFFFGSGDIAGFDFSGKKLWQRNLQKDYGTFAFLWTFATSPLLYEGKLYMQVLQRDVPVSGGRGRRGGGSAGGKFDSYLLAMNPQTGETLWRHVRPSKARAESREAFTTPIPHERGGRKEILVIGGDALTGHDPANGKELWRWETWNPSRIGHRRHVPSPVVGKDMVLVCAPKMDPIYAIKAGGEGQLGKDDVAWVSRDNASVSSDVPTPAYYDGDFFVLSDLRKHLSRVDPRTGKVKWSTPTPGRSKYEASPLAADGKIYCVNFDGEVAVFSARDGSSLKNVAMQPKDEYPIRSSIVAAYGQLFIRMNRKLYCVGKK